jgi:hypothetical protein
MWQRNLTRPNGREPTRLFNHFQLPRQVEQSQIGSQLSTEKLKKTEFIALERLRVDEAFIQGREHTEPSTSHFDPNLRLRPLSLQKPFCSLPFHCIQLFSNRMGGAFSSSISTVAKQNGAASISAIDRDVLDLKNARDRLQRGYRQKLERDDAALLWAAAI